MDDKKKQRTNTVPNGKLIAINPDDKRWLNIEAGHLEISLKKHLEEIIAAAGKKAKRRFNK